jgi:hypothetical protein
MVFGVVLVALCATPLEAGELVRRAARDADHIEIIWPFAGDVASAFAEDAGPSKARKPPKTQVLVEHDRAEVQSLLNLVETDTFVPVDGTVGHLCIGWPVVRVSKGHELLVELRYEHEAFLSAEPLWHGAAELVPWVQRPLNAWFARHGFAFFEMDFAKENAPVRPTPGLRVIAAPKPDDEGAEFLARSYRGAEENEFVDEAIRALPSLVEPPCDTIVMPVLPLMAALLRIGASRVPPGTVDALTSRRWKCPINVAAANIATELASERVPRAADLQAVDRRTASWVLLRLEATRTREAVDCAVDGLLGHPDPAVRRITAGWLVRLGAPGPATPEPDAVARQRDWWTTTRTRWKTDAGVPR